MVSDEETGASAGARGESYVGPQIFRAAGRWTVSAGPAPVAAGPAPRNSGADRAALRAIQDAGRAGDLGRAADMAEAALEAGLEHPIVLNLCALKLGAAGRLEESAALLRRVLELEPAEAGVLNALGQCLSGLERAEEALAMFDAALALAPGLAEAHGNRGWALRAMGELKGAEASYRRALELEPGHAGASAGMALLCSGYGDHAEASRFAEAALEIEPASAPAAVAMATVELAQGATAAAEARLRALLADPRPNGLQKSLARSLLGDVLDAQGRVQEAFDAYAASGQERRRHYAGRFGGEAVGDVERLAAYFETAAPGDWAPPDVPRLRTVGRPAQGPRGHVFLLGFPRSGTTLLEQALAGHPDVEVLSEQEPLTDAVCDFLEAPGGLDRLAGASPAALEPYRNSYWRHVREAGANPDGKVLVDKNPLDTLKLPVIVKLFPEARILFARRDPRDVVLSCFRRRFRMTRPMYDMLTLEGAAALYAATMQLASRIQAIAGLSFRTIGHEALVADFDNELRSVCDWLRLPWTDAMRDFPARIRARAVSTPSAAQLARGLNADGVGQWRRYGEQMRPVLPIIAPWVERFGYDVLHNAPRRRAPAARAAAASA